MDEQLIRTNKKINNAKNIFATTYESDNTFFGMDKESLYLRVILNSVCNAKCYFCHEEGKKVFKNLPTDILLQVVSDSVSLGFKKVKYTGGEPLLHKDLASITSRIKSIDHEIEISLTTNGILIKENIDELLDAGLDRMNISLHSMDRENYKRIVGVDALDKVLNGLDYVSKLGVKGFKINMTVSTYNLNELPAIAEYANDNGFEFRIHNLLPSNKEAENTLVSASDIKRFLENYTDFKEKIIQNGKLTTRYHGHNYSVDVKYSRFNKKCKRCSYVKKCNEGIYALRLTPEAILRPCLYRDDLQLDFHKAIEEGNSREVMFEAYKRVVI